MPKTGEIAKGSRPVAVGFAAVLLTASIGYAAGLDTPSPGAALAGPDQIAAERTVLFVLADPAVKAKQAEIRNALLLDPVAATPDGLARLDHAIQEWTTSLAFKEIARDPARPRILWITDDTPHSWFGLTIDGAAIAGDNPDHIYRGAQLDGAGRYEIDGWVASNRPAQFSFEATRENPNGAYILKRQTAGHVDMGNQVAMLIDPDVRVSADGSFRLTLDDDPSDGRPNHIHLEPGPIALNIRDVLSDWRQSPNRLEIRRVDAAPHGQALAPTDIRDRTVADLPAFIKFWSGFKDTWLGGLKPSSIVKPVPRDGGWGYQSAGRYDLAPDEADVITIQDGGAAYFGLQVTDPWMIAPDARVHQTSLNTSQVARNADGSVTYVISATDPGVANWIDTGGLHHGYFLIRWEGFPKDAKPGELLRGFRTVKLSDLAGPTYAGLPRIAPGQRRSQLAERAVEYAERLKD